MKSIYHSRTVLVVAALAASAVTVSPALAAAPGNANTVASSAGAATSALVAGPTAGSWVEQTVATPALLQESYPVATAAEVASARRSRRTSSSARTTSRSPTPSGSRSRAPRRWASRR